jgi:AhpD family alkylhydroperoxidase
VSQAGPRPEIARASAALIRAVSQTGTVSPETKELCGLMVSWLNGCERCVAAHAAYAKKLGVEAAKLEALFDYARSDRFDGAQRAALAAAVAITREPRALPPSLRDRLRQHFDAGQIYELLSAIGVANYLTRVDNALSDATLDASCVPVKQTVPAENGSV